MEFVHAAPQHHCNVSQVLAGCFAPTTQYAADVTQVNSSPSRNLASVCFSYEFGYFFRTHCRSHTKRVPPLLPRSQYYWLRDRPIVSPIMNPMATYIAILINPMTAGPGS